MPNQAKKPNIHTRNSSNMAAKSGLAHSTDANQEDQANLDAKPSKPNVDNASLAADIAKMYPLLKETSEKQEEKLNIIQRTTTAVESKLAEITTHIGDVEAFMKMLIKLWKMTPQPPRQTAKSTT